MSIDKNQMELLKQLLSTKTNSLVSEIKDFEIGSERKFSESLQDVLGAIGESAEFLRAAMVHAMQHYDFETLQEVLNDALDAVN